MSPSLISTALLTMTTTAAKTLPVSTVVIDTTILRTSFVTVLWTTNLVQTSTIIPTISVTSASQPTSISTSKPSASLSSSVSTGVLSSAISAALSSASLSLAPSVIVPDQTDPTASSPIPMITSSSPSSSPAPAFSPGTAKKHAIIGGLSGAIAGLVLIGAIIFFCLRRRRQAQEEESQSVSEKGVRPVIARKWTELTMKGTPKPTPRVENGNSAVDVDEHHHIIRMSTQHWPRPFAQGQGEGFRESMVPGQLRVVNPDVVSRPTTPRTISDSAGDFLKKQRSALAAVLLKSATRSRASSRSTTRPLSQVLPDIVIDPSLSKECIAPMAATPSFKSYPSVVSLPVIQQSPVEDPFITPPDEKSEPDPSPRRITRPSLTPLQSAAGVASRTLSHLGSALSAFRLRPDLRDSTQAPARDSTATVSTRSSWRDTGYSDPFYLDQPSVRGSHVAHGQPAHGPQRQTDLMTPYEGT